MQNLMQRVCTAVLISAGVMVSSIAAGATIGPVGPFHSLSGKLILKSPATFQNPLTCNVSFAGEVDGYGVAKINAVLFSGASTYCQNIRVAHIPWSMKAVGQVTLNITDIEFSLTGFPGAQSYCGPSTISTSWRPPIQQVEASNQALSGNCTITSLEVVFPSLNVSL